jgi:RNA polymerase sigma factor for flagellar operon FliA
MSELYRPLTKRPSPAAGDPTVTELWTAYKSQPGHLQLREKLILNYLHLVRHVVNRLPVTLPVSIAQEDLVSYGTMGLIEAIERFDISRGLKFETYAVTRIRGSIIDNLRFQDWVPRGVRKRARDLSETMTRLEGRLGRTPTEDEVAAEMGVSKIKLQAILSESNNLIISLDEQRGSDESSGTSLMELVEDKNSPSPQAGLEHVEMKSRLASAIGQLPEREKLLIALYYHENMTLKEIGEVIRVSESRVCQLHAQAILRLRGFLE